MNTTFLTISKTGAYFGKPTDLASDSFPGNAVYFSTENARELSIQLYGGGAYTIIPQVANEAGVYEPIQVFRNSAGTTVTSFSAQDVYHRPAGYYSRYMRLVISGADTDMKIIVAGLN